LSDNPKIYAPQAALLIPLMVLSLLLAGCTAGVFEKTKNTTGQQQTQPSHWSEDAINAFNKGVVALGKDNEVARVSFAEAIEYEPKMEPAYYNLAKLDLDQKNYQAVATFQQQSQTHNVASARLLNLFATAKRQQHDFESAKKDYLAAIQLDSSYTPALLNIAILNDVYLGNLDQALKYYLLYQQQLQQQSKQDNRVKNWLTDIQRRLAPKTGGGE